MDYGKRFRFFRERTGLNQSQAAEMIGVKNYQIGNYETNRSEPNIATLKKMSAVYGVTIDKLLGNKYADEFSSANGNQIDFDELAEKLQGIVDELNGFTSGK